MKTPSAVIPRLSPMGQATLCLWILALAAPVPALAVPVIPNPSFEANAAFASSPGTVALNSPITGWTVNDPTRVGLNPAGGLNFHADNGIVPNGTRVAFLQSDGNNTAKLSTTLTGLVAGRHYRVQFRFNRKSGAVGNTPSATCRVNGGTVQSLFGFPAANTVGVHTNPYLTSNLLFVATGPTALLEISNTTSANSTLLVDNFIVTEATPLQVTNLNNDGPGSLRQALVFAAATPAFNLITFAPALSGQAIALLSGLTIKDAGGVAIDATALPKGIALSASTGATGFRLVSITAETTSHLRGLTLSGGLTGNQGALDVSGPHTAAILSRCTLSGNGSPSTTPGGAVTVSTATAALTQCTLTENVADDAGGAIAADTSGRVFVDQCTISGNECISGPGGGIFNVGLLTITNSIVAGNSAASGADIENFGGKVTRVGANLIQAYANSGGGTDTGPAATNAAPLLEALADNGGPTRTMSVQAGSPARNASVSSPFTTDQRGRTVQGAAHDLGAFDVQRGTFVLDPGGSVLETTATKNVFVRRVDGFEGNVSVRLSTTNGTAGALDFTAVVNQTVNFTDTQLSQIVPITILNDALVEANETFNVALNTPSAGTTLGTASATTVVIVDPSSLSPATDTVAPSPPVILTPTANASVNVENSIVITGTASDNKGVLAVQVRLTGDGGAPTAFTNAVVDTPQAATTRWSVTLPITTPITNLLIEAQAFDTAARVSTPLATRTVKLLHPLRVAINGNGSVTPAGFTPSSFRVNGSSNTITATPAAGQLFTGWTVVGFTGVQIGVPDVALTRPTLIFLHRAGLGLIANFVPSPYVTNPNLTGSYKNLLAASNSVPAGGTVPSNSTEGLLSLTVAGTGAFSGTLVIDGFTLIVAGALDQDGVARFGTSRSPTVRIARGPTKPSLELAFNLVPDGAGGFFPVMIGSVIARDFRNVITARSDIAGSTRASFNGTTSVLGPPFVSATGSAVYNVCFRPVPTASQPSGLPENVYPQGTGFGRVTLTKAGIITFVGTLADGTGVTGSTFVDSSPNAILFIPLYNKGGFLRTVLTFNPSAVGSDVTGQGVGLSPTWARPAGTSHHYHDGWPEVINLNMDGAIYNPVSGVSVLKPPSTGASLQPPDADGNAALTFTKGQLTQNLPKALNFPTTDAVVRVPANDATFTFTLTRSTGLFSGTFLHTDNTTTTFKGIIHPKAPSSGGFGFFLTTPPSPIDFTGESGQVQLTGQQ